MEQAEDVIDLKNDVTPVPRGHAARQRRMNNVVLIILLMFVSFVFIFSFWHREGEQKTDNPAFNQNIM